MVGAILGQGQFGEPSVPGYRGGFAALGVEF